MPQEKKALLIFILQTVRFVTQNVSVQAEKLKLLPNRGERETLQPFENLELTFNKAEKKWRFAIFQVHVQKNNVTLSLSQNYSYGKSVMGANVAVLFPFPIRETSYPFYLKSENNYSSYQIDVIGIPYEDGVPFPGACCLTCSMEFDPNIAISYDSVETRVTFAFANVYYKRSPPDKQGSKAPPCDGNTIKGKHDSDPEHFRLEYDVYLMFLPEGDESEESFFKSVEKMAYPDRIKNHGTKVSTLKAPKVPLLRFLTHPAGQGVVYNVIVRDPNNQMEAAYSPAVSYGCHDCKEEIAAVDAVFAIIGSICGLIFCFFGFRLFKFTLFFGGLVNFAMLLFIIISANSDMSHSGCMLISAALGILFGTLIFALWWFTEWTRLCLLIDALFLGFLVGATLMFTPFGDLEIFRTNEFDYGSVLCACTIVVPVILVLWPRVLCIAYTSIVSSYGFVVGIGCFLHTSISFIVVDVVLHATKRQFHGDQIIIVTSPFQQNDYILSATWVVLAVLGIVVQTVFSRNKGFPKSGFIEQRRRRKYFINKYKNTEATPILINSDQHGAYGTNNIC